MTHSSASVFISVPPDLIFQRLPRIFEGWRRLDTGPLAAGSRFAVPGESGERRITELSSPHTLALSHSDGSGRVFELRYDVSPQGVGSVLRVSYSVTAANMTERLASPLYSWLLQRRISRDLTRLKDELERG